MSPFRACAVLDRYSSHEKISDLYDGDDSLQEALSALIENFEYPNVSHMTIAEVQERYGRG